MKLHWLLSGILGFLLMGLPANAGKLLSWDFASQNNRLTFTTDEGVQPQVKLVENPTRLVIELPGTVLGRTTVKEKYLGSVRGFRVGQSAEETVSLVLELAPGYDIDVNQVKLSNSANRRWTIDIPSPRIAPAAIANNRPTPNNINEKPLNRDRFTSPINPPNNSRPVPPPKPELNSSPQNNNNRTSSSSRYVKPTSHGFFVEIDGDRSNRVNSRRNGNTITFDLEGVTFPQDLVSQSVNPGKYGVQEINFSQPSGSSARITLQLAPNSPNWLATFSRIGGLILVPRGDLPVTNESTPIVRNNPNNSPRNNSNNPRNNNSNNPRNSNRNSTTVTAIAVAHDNSRLIIRSDRNIRPQTKFVRNGIYEIKVPNAKLIEPFPNPRLKAGSPITQLRVRQEGADVVFVVTTRLGARLGNAIQQSSNLIALPISVPTRTVVDRTRTPIVQQPATPPRNSRPLVIIDPGHGGQDPGTIGIGGVKEKNVILPIALDVAAELKKQGVEVRMTRDRDYFVSLQGRTDFANKVNADLFVSIHANAINLSRPDVNGLETYYYQSGRRLAEIIHWNILNSVNIKNRNVRRARFYVLRHSKMPATLVEVGFLTGAEDSVRLKTPGHRQKMAKAIAQGILQYIREKQI